tara:strand:+ start:357 stop:494 length:138 start_codon:yes stop_codon:yes gene_type:complete
VVVETVEKMQVVDLHHTHQEKMEQSTLEVAVVDQVQVLLVQVVQV